MGDADFPVTGREFDLLRDMVREGFEGTHARLDAIDEKQRIANGRTSTLEKESAGMLERLGAVERDIKRMVERRVRLADIKIRQSGLSRRDLKVAGFMLGAGAALMEYGPKVIKALLALGGGQ